MKKYAVSFGDSDKYIVSFDGSKQEFEKSDKLRVIKDRVAEYLKEKFPVGGYSETVELNVEEASGDKGFQNLDEAGLESLLHSVGRQVEVLLEGEELTNNAPYDKI